MESHERGADELKENVYEKIREFENGLVDSELRVSFANVDKIEFVGAINALLTEQRIDILRLGAQIFYKVKCDALLEKLKESGTAEAMIYQTIEDTRSRGIWVRDLKLKCNVPQALLNKTLKQLEGRKLIKCISSISNSRQKCYMLYDLTPDAELSGGTFYAEQKLDTQFLEAVGRQCLKFLKQKATEAQSLEHDHIAFTPSTVICNFINELKVSKVKLCVEEVEKIMDCMALQLAVECDRRGETKAYRIFRPVHHCGALAQSPCFFCPVFSDCKMGGTISPATCVYFENMF